MASLLYRVLLICGFPGCALMGLPGFGSSPLYRVSSFMEWLVGYLLFSVFALFSCLLCVFLLFLVLPCMGYCPSAVLGLLFACMGLWVGGGV